MNKDILDRIFTRFNQVDEFHLQIGIRLGLQILKRVELEKNKGKNVNIILPSEEINHKIII